MSSGSSRAEQHAQLPPLGLARRRAPSASLSASRGFLGRRPQGGDRLQELFAVAERDAELPQILIVEVRKNLTVDRVLGENRRILGKPDLVQPCCHVVRRSHPAAPFVR
jgi:hypothetical protein